MKPVDEPLALSAPLARRLAPTLCYQDPATGERCSWSHGLWQVLRLLGLVTTPAHHADFYHDALATVPADRAPCRALISAAADYGMLAQVLAAFRARNVPVEITVVDICETPLMLNRWYAERLAQRIETVRSDILDYDAALPFDVICTHAFLGRFSPEQRPQLLARWRKLLKPGGVAVTVNRVRPAHQASRVTFRADDARAFGDLVRARADALPPSLHIDPETLAGESEEYANRQQIHPVRSPAEVEDLFKRAGFRLQHFSCGALARGSHEVAGPTIAGGADYAHVIAAPR